MPVITTLECRSTTGADQCEMSQPGCDISYCSDLIMTAICAALQSQKAVSAYLESKQILPFGFARQCASRHGENTPFRILPDRSPLLWLHFHRGKNNSGSHPPAGDYGVLQGALRWGGCGLPGIYGTVRSQKAVSSDL